MNKCIQSMLKRISKNNILMTALHEKIENNTNEKIPCPFKIPSWTNFDVYSWTETQHSKLHT